MPSRSLISAMPGFDGLEVVHRLRKRGQTLPVLFLTARSNVADRVKGLNAGADDYLPETVRAGGAWMPACARRCAAVKGEPGSASGWGGVGVR